MNPLLIHCNLVLLFNIPNHYHPDNLWKKGYVKLVLNQTNWCTKCFSDLKFKNHVYHHLLKDLFYRHLNYHLCEIFLVSQFDGHVVNMHPCLCCTTLILTISIHEICCYLSIGYSNIIIL